MGRLWTKADVGEYKEYDRKLTKQFIHGLDREGMISGILMKALLLEDINDARDEWVLLWLPKSRNTESMKGGIRKHQRGQGL